MKALKCKTLAIGAELAHAQYYKHPFVMYDDDLPTFNTCRQWSANELVAYLNNCHVATVLISNGCQLNFYVATSMIKKWPPSSCQSKEQAIPRERKCFNEICNGQQRPVW